MLEDERMFKGTSHMSCVASTHYPLAEDVLIRRSLPVMMIILLILATVSARGCRSQPRFNLGPKQLSLLVTHLNHLILTIIKTA